MRLIQSFSCLRNPQIKMAQALVPLLGAWLQFLCTHPLLVGCGSGVGPGYDRTLPVSHRDRCLLTRKQILPAHWSHKLSHLNHSTEGAAGVAPSTWWCLCSWGVPVLGRVRKHQQGTAAVCGVFQICQGGLCRGQWMFQVPGQCTLHATVPWGWQAGLRRLKSIVICRRPGGCQKQVRSVW